MQHITKTLCFLGISIIGSKNHVCFLDFRVAFQKILCFWSIQSSSQKPLVFLDFRAVLQKTLCFLGISIGSKNHLFFCDFMQQFKNPLFSGNFFHVANQEPYFC